MNCPGCGLELPVGAAHVNQDSCIEALKHALAQARNCQGCGSTVEVVACPRCAATAFGKGVVTQGAKAAAGQLLDWLTSQGKGPTPGGKMYRSQ